MSLNSEIESLLFIAGKPLTANKLAEMINKDKKEVQDALGELVLKYDAKDQGIKLMRNGNKYELVSSQQNSKIVKKFLKDELTGELTKPSLEALSIIAYRGPVTKGELEIIRGVNCSLILRNLLIRGLIEEEEKKEDKLTYYQITFGFMRYLGISAIQELPNYERLNRNKNLEELLKEEETRKQEQKT